jgi:arabinose-5-phosphate isomerase
MNSNHYKEAHRIFDAEIEGLKRTKERVNENFSQSVELILGSKGKVVVAGIGKSGIIGHKIAATLASTGTSAVYLNAGEALHGDLGVVNAEDVVLMLSNSAATTELVHMLPSIKQIGAKMIGLFGQSDTALAQACDLVLDASVEQEACSLGLAPMTSSTVALVMGDALASALMQARGFKPDDFAVYHPGGSLGRRLLLRVCDVMHPVADDFPVVVPELPLREALSVMSISNLGGLIVAEANKIKGVFTDGDLRRYVLEGCSLDAPICEFMTNDPITVQDSMRLGEILDLMEASGRKIYFVPVSNAAGELSGALRMHDIVSDG